MQATVAEGTSVPCVDTLHVAPASVEPRSIPKLDVGADEPKPTAAATHRDAPVHAVAETVATLRGSAMRRQDLPEFVDA